MTGATPMFPLQSVLFPYLPLPLHVFEDRYRQMVRELVAPGATAVFGVVLIERGPEVGGGDVRTDIGTLATVVEAEEVPDGRWAVLAVGSQRLRVQRWLPDDPYPRAEVELLADGAAAGPLLDDAERVVRRSLALKAELAEPAAPMTVELSDDPLVRGWQLCAISPLGPVDRQRLLGIDDADERLRLLAEVVDEECAVLAHRLAGA